MVLEWSIASLKGRSEVDISGDNATIEKTEHTILNVVFSNWWWICEWIISEILGQNPFCKEYFIWPPCSYSQFLEFDVANSSLRSAIFEQIWLRKHIFVSQYFMTAYILRITCKIVEFLLIHQDSHRLAQQCQFFRNSWLLSFHLLFELHRLSFVRNLGEDSFIIDTDASC